MDASQQLVAPTTEERLLSALAHLSALLMGPGLALPILFWSEYRRKSKYLSFQSLQALVYQTVGYTLWFLVYLLVFVLFFVGLIVLAGLFPQVDEAAVALGIVLYVLAAVFVPLGVYLLLPVVGALGCALGRDFRYPFMGRLAASLNGEAGSGWFEAEREERWVAAAGHFSVMIPLWGLSVPVLALFTQGRGSPYLKFQALQTLIYQVLGTVGVFGVLLLTGGVGLAFLIFVSVNPAVENGMVVLAALLFLVVWMLALLLLPLYHILGQWAGVRTLQGHNYRYPLVWRLAARWATPQEENQ